MKNKNNAQVSTINRVRNSMEYLNTLSSQQPHPRAAGREWGPSLRLQFPPPLKQRVGPDERQGLKMLLFVPVLEPY